jgi:hypothetical protein
MNKRFLSVEVAQQNILKRLQALEDLTSKNNIQQQQLLTTMEKVMCLLHQCSNYQQLHQYSNYQQLRVDAQTGIAVLGPVDGICRTGVEVGVSDVEVVVSGVDVAGIGEPTAIICASGFSTAVKRRFL